MNFILYEHLGCGGPIKEQKASADFASSVVKARQHQQNKRWQQKCMWVKAFAEVLMVRMTKEIYKTVWRKKLFPSQLSGVSFE